MDRYHIRWVYLILLLLRFFSIENVIKSLCIKRLSDCFTGYCLQLTECVIWCSFCLVKVARQTKIPSNSKQKGYTNSTVDLFFSNGSGFSIIVVFILISGLKLFDIHGLKLNWYIDTNQRKYRKGKFGSSTIYQINFPDNFSFNIKEKFNSIFLMVKGSDIFMIWTAIRFHVSINSVFRHFETKPNFKLESNWVIRKVCWYITMSVWNESWVATRKDWNVAMQYL